MSSVDDLKYAYYSKALGVSGLSINDLEQQFFANGGAFGVKPNIPDPKAVDSLYTPAPTVATATWVEPGASYTLYPSDIAGTNFLYRGASDFAFGGAFPDTIMLLPTSKYPHAYTTPQSIWSVEFMTDAPDFKVYFKHTATTAVYRLKVNGKRVTDLPQSTGGTTLGSRHNLSFDFGGDRSVKRICLEFATVPFAGIYIPDTSSLWKPQPYLDKVIVLGDSIAGGSTMNTGSAQGSWVARLAEMMGWDDIWNSSIGGTGYVADSPDGTPNTFKDRIGPDVTAYKPKKIILFGGYNDSAENQATILANARSVAANINAVVPTATVAMSGPWSPDGPASANIISTNTTLKTVATENGWIFIDQINGDVWKGSLKLADSSAWITGTGNTGATTGEGNSDFYVGTDNVHPNDAGHKYLADRMYRALLTAGF